MASRTVPGEESILSSRSIARALVPAPLRQGLRSRLTRSRRRSKAPRMDVGYVDSTGQSRPHVRISDTAFIDHQDRLVVEDFVYIGHFTILDATGGLTIEEGCQITSLAAVFTHSSHQAIRLYGRHYNDVHGDEREAYFAEPVRIGRYSHLGAAAIVLPGVSIGRGCVIGAGSVVTRDVLDFQIVAGSPARVVGDTRDHDAPYLENARLRALYEEWQR